MTGQTPTPVYQVKQRLPRADQVGHDDLAIDEDWLAVCFLQGSGLEVREFDSDNDEMARAVAVRAKTDCFWWWQTLVNCRLILSESEQGGLLVWDLESSNY